MRLIDADELYDRINKASCMVYSMPDYGNLLACEPGLTVKTIVNIIASMPTIVNTGDYYQLYYNGMTFNFSYRGYTVKGEWDNEDKIYTGMAKDGTSGYIEVQGNSLPEFYKDFCEGVDDYIAFREDQDNNK